MANLVLGIAGAAVGSLFGAPQIGWLVGSTLGSMLGQPDQHSEGPRVSDLKVQASTYGAMVPILYGTMRTAGNVVFATDKREVATTTEQDGKGGPEITSTSYSYNVDIAIALCANTIAGIRKVWSNGKLIYDVSSSADAATIIASETRSSGFKVYLGSETQLPDPTIEATVGVGLTPAYRGTAYVVFSALDCPNGQIPQLSFEVATQAGNSPAGVLMANIPGSASDFMRVVMNSTGHYAYSQLTANPGVYTFGAGYAAKAGPMTEQAGKSFAWVPVQGGPDPWVMCCFFTSGSYGTPLELYVQNLKTGIVSLLYSYIPGSSANSLRPYSAAYDSVSGKYCATSSDGTAGSRGTMITIMPSGVTTAADSVPTNTPLAFYDNVIYSLSYAGAITYLNRWDGATGALLSQTAGPNVGISQHRIQADAAGVFVWVMGGSNSAVYKVSASAWTLLASGLNAVALHSNDIGFYATDSYVAWAPNYISSSVYEARIAAYNAVAPTEPTVASVLTDICTRAGLAAGKIDAAGLADTLTGYALTNVSSARANLGPLLKCWFIDVAETDDKIRFRKRASIASAATIGYDELGTVEDGSDPGDPMPLQRTQEPELPRSVAINFINKDSDYQPGTETSRRIITASINDLVDELPIATTAARAATVADAMLYDLWNERNKRSLKVPRKYAYLDAGDVVTVEYPQGVYTAKRLTRGNDTGVLCEFDAVDSDASIYTVSASGATPANAQTGLTLAPPARLELLDIPILRDADDNPGLYVALSSYGPSWPGGLLYMGVDDASLTLRGGVSAPAVIGFADTALGAWPYHMMDETNTVTVTLPQGTLSSTTRDAVLDSGANAALLGSEIIQFTTATSLGGGQYRLSGLLRGLRGTEAQASTHAAGERFVLLQVAGLLRPNFDLSDLDRSLSFRAVSTGLALASAASVAGINTGKGLEPISPVNLRTQRLDNGDIRLTWDRRTRLTDNWLAGSLPLGEASESYELDVLMSGVVKRTLSSSIAQVDYALADQYTDAGAPVSAADVKVYQLSASVGRGNVLAQAIAVALPVGGSTFVGGSSIVLFPALKAGSALLAYSSAVYGGNTLHKLFESYDDGASFAQLAGLGAPITRYPTHRSGRADGVYVSIMGELVNRLDTTDVFVTRGVAGSAPVVTAAKFSKPFLPVAVGNDGSKFVVITEGNKVYTSTDGSSWALAGTTAGLPTYASSSVYGNWGSNYGSGAALIWAASRWFITFTGQLYYTTSAGAVTGWTACTLPANVVISGYVFASLGGNLFVLGTKIVSGVNSQVILKSTDSGSTWTAVLDPAVGIAGDVFNLGGNLVAVDYDFEGKTNLSTNSGASWTSPANGQSYVDRYYPVQAGANVLIAGLRASPGAGEPNQQLRYSANGTTFTNSTGL